MCTARGSANRSRTIAIGDIHGHVRALAGLLALVAPRPEDTLVLLGDYVSRGPDSREVIQTVIDLGRRCRVVALRGNHEEMLIDALRDPEALAMFVAVGGDAGLVSPQPRQRNRALTGEHWAFLEGLPLCHETDSHFFVHANYAPNRPLSDQDRQTALWLPIDPPPGPHYSGKTVVVGHTSQIDGRVLNLGHLVCIDTGCGFGGLLTAFDVGTGQVWQVDESGSWSP
jgi:serine/threonine protein phosphatase 1